MNFLFIDCIVALQLDKQTYVIITSLTFSSRIVRHHEEKSQQFRDCWRESGTKE